MAGGVAVDLDIEGFTPIEVIGRGGSATVYRARELAFDREVALKVLNVEIGAADQQRFSRELRSIGRLGEAHHAIALVFSTGVTRQNNPFLSMRYYPGGSLQAAVKRLGRVDLPDALTIADCIGGALDTAHAAGILHRDVKPANVLLDGKQLAVLADFGIASFVEGVGETSNSLSMMTPAYAAPERIKGEPATAASDIYSLSATLWSVLAGRVPHAQTTSDSLATIIHRIMGGDIVPLDRSDLPPLVEQVLRRGLDSNPELRPTSAAELVAELKEADSRVITSVPFGAALTGQCSPFPTTNPKGQPGPADLPWDPNAARTRSAATGESDTPDGDLDETTVARPIPSPAASEPTPDEGSRSPYRKRALAAAALLPALLVTWFLVRDDRGERVVKVEVEGTSETRVPPTVPHPDAETIPPTNPSTPADTVVPPVEPGISTPADADGHEANPVKPTNPPNPGSPAKPNRSSPPAASEPSPESPIVSPAPSISIPITVSPESESLICLTGGAPVTFSPGLGLSDAGSSWTLASPGSTFGNCTNQSHGITSGNPQGFVLTFQAVNCLISSQTTGTGVGTITWSDGSQSQATLKLQMKPSGFEKPKGTATWSITGGLFAGSTSSSESGLDFEGRNWG